MAPRAVNRAKVGTARARRRSRRVWASVRVAGWVDWEGAGVVTGLGYGDSAVPCADSTMGQNLVVVAKSTKDAAEQITSRAGGNWVFHAAGQRHTEAEASHGS